MDYMDKKNSDSNIGMVTTAHYDASRVGAEILNKGGNAFDAAVAAGFALGVCEPNASGLGGGGFMTAHIAKENRNTFVDFREVAPQSANPDMWNRDENGKIVNDEKSEGGKSVCIPGEPAGLCYILKKYGTMSLKEVLEPAIELADKGIRVTEALHNDLLENRNKLCKFSDNSNPYIKDYAVNDLLINKQLAEVLRQLSEKGPDCIYNGEFTEKIIQGVNQYGGQFTKSDFNNYHVNEYEPLEGSYRGYKIISSPPPSSGGTHVIEILNILENFQLQKMDYHSIDHIHLMSEVFKMCFADRKEHMGDPKYVDIPLKSLISKEYAHIRAALYSPHYINSAKPGNPKDVEPCDTTHLSIADRYGNMVSITKTISAFFGSGVVPSGTGIVMNCQMRGFSSEYNHKNSVCGGKKPLSSMSPTIILKDDQPFAILGTPGGNRIISTMAQLISNLIDFNMSLEKAIDSPRIYNDVENILHYESRIDESVINNISCLGQQVKEHAQYDRYFGGVHGICFLKNGLINGVADPRRDGKAIGCN